MDDVSPMQKRLTSGGTDGVSFALDGRAIQIDNNNGYLFACMYRTYIFINI